MNANNFFKLLNEGQVAEFVILFSEQLRKGNEKICEDAIPFALCVIRSFSFMENPSNRVKDFVEECKEVRSTPTFIKLCLQYKIPYPVSGTVMVETHTKEEAAINAAAFFLYADKPALQIRLIAYAMNVLAYYDLMDVQSSAWAWQERKA